MATEKRLKGIPYKCDNCIHTASCQRACSLFAFPFLDYMIRSASCTAYEPKVDAVEVVRCEDCKYWQRIHEHIPHMECQIFCGAYEHGYPTNADDYCSYGERK